MKSFILFFLLFSLHQLQAQFSRSFNHNRGLPASSGCYVAKHPTDDIYYAFSLKTIVGMGYYYLTAIDGQGVTQWYQEVTTVGTSSNLCSTGDIMVSSSNIYTSAYDFNSFTLNLYKYDFAGGLIDTLVIPGVSGIKRCRANLAMDSNGNIVTAIKDGNNNYRFCKIDTASLDLISDVVVGNSTFTTSESQRAMFLNINGTETIFSYNSDDTTHFKIFNAAGSITNSFYILSPDGQATDVQLVGNTFYILINKYFIPSAAVDNPIRIITAEYDGTVLTNTTYPVSNATVFTSLDVDTDGSIYVSARNQISYQLAGAIIKIMSGVIQYEYAQQRMDLNEVSIIDNNIISSGTTLNGTEEYDQWESGNVFVKYKKNSIPDFELITTNTKLEYNNISASINYNSKNYSDHNLFPGLNVNGAGSTIYTSNLLIIGQDIDSDIHSSCNLYENVFASGPATNPAGYTLTEGDKWDRVWKLTRQQVDDHIQAYLDGDASYKIPEAILHWPAHGDTTIGQDYFLARFQDLNGNMIYEPLLGEYPLIKGDYCVLSIYNDINADSVFAYTQLDERMNVQIIEYQYGFACDQDSSMQNTLFAYYEVVNKGSETIYHAYIGNFMDMDINDPLDEYISSDPLRGMLYQRSDDGNGPEQGYIILGSKMDDDGLDNAYGIAFPDSPNGCNYANGIIDDERLGMSNMVYFVGSSGPNGVPQTSQDFYYFMQSYWKNGNPVLFGGDGYLTGTTTQPSTFMFQGDADNLFYATSGIDPGFSWTEESAGQPSGDRRGIANSGPFNFYADDTIFFDIALVTGMKNVSAGYTSHEALLNHVDSMRNYFHANEIPCGQNFYFYAPFNGTYPSLSVTEEQVFNPMIYPNPTSGIITVRGINANTTIQIYSTNGSLVYSGTSTFSEEIDLSGIQRGIYFVILQDDANTRTIKLIIQ